MPAADLLLRRHPQRQAAQVGRRQTAHRRHSTTDTQGRKDGRQDHAARRTPNAKRSIGRKTTNCKAKAERRNLKLETETDAVDERTNERTDERQFTPQKPAKFRNFVVRSNVRSFKSLSLSSSSSSSSSSSLLLSSSLLSLSSSSSSSSTLSLLLSSFVGAFLPLLVCVVVVL